MGICDTNGIAAGIANGVVIIVVVLVVLVEEVGIGSTVIGAVIVVGLGLEVG